MQLQLHKELLRNPSTFWSVVNKTTKALNSSVTVDPKNLLSHFKLMKENHVHEHLGSMHSLSNSAPYVLEIDEEITCEETLYNINTGIIPVYHPVCTNPVTQFTFS